MKKKKGFTLTELIAVIAILAVVALIGVLVYKSLVKKIREREYSQLISNIYIAGEKYTNKTGINRMYVQDLIDAGFLTTSNKDGYILKPTNNKESVNCFYIDTSYPDEIDETDRNDGYNDEKYANNRVWNYAADSKRSTVCNNDLYDINSFTMLFNTTLIDSDTIYINTHEGTLYISPNELLTNLGKKYQEEAKKLSDMDPSYISLINDENPTGKYEFNKNEEESGSVFYTKLSVTSDGKQKYVLIIKSPDGNINIKKTFYIVYDTTAPICKIDKTSSCTSEQFKFTVSDDIAVGTYSINETLQSIYPDNIKKEIIDYKTTNQNNNTYTLTATDIAGNTCLTVSETSSGMVEQYNIKYKYNSKEIDQNISIDKYDSENLKFPSASDINLDANIEILKGWEYNGNLYDVNDKITIKDLDSCISNYEFNAVTEAKGAEIKYDGNFPISYSTNPNIMPSTQSVSINGLVNVQYPTQDSIKLITSYDKKLECHGFLNCERVDNLNKPNYTTYYFECYSKTSNGSCIGDTEISYNDIVSENNNHILTLYAKWTKETKKKITYNGNGKNFNNGSQTATDEFFVSTYLKTSNDLAPSGYSISKWCTRKDCKTRFLGIRIGYQYDPGSLQSFSKSTTLYAKWSKNTLTITYNANGGTNAPANDTTTTGSFTVTSETPTAPAGKKFSYWCSTAKCSVLDFSVQKYNAGSTYSIDDDVTLYAQYTTADKYTIKYNKGSCSILYPSIFSQTKTKDIDLKLSTTTPSCTSKTFKGWNTKSDGSGTSYSPGDTYKDNSSVTLYAQWEGKYTIKYIDKISSACNGHITESTKEYSENDNATIAMHTDCDGYTFKGWGDIFGNFIIAEGTIYTGKSDLTLYPIWQQDERLVTINYVDSTYHQYPDGITEEPYNSITTTYTIPYANPTHKGSTFWGWNGIYYYGSSVLVFGNQTKYDITLNAFWVDDDESEDDDSGTGDITPTDSSYTLTYDDYSLGCNNNGPITKNKNESWGTLCSPLTDSDTDEETKEDYEFLGWYDENINSSNKYDQITSTSKATKNINVKGSYVYKINIGVNTLYSDDSIKFNTYSLSKARLNDYYMTDNDNSAVVDLELKSHYINGERKYIVNIAPTCDAAYNAELISSTWIVNGIYYIDATKDDPFESLDVCNAKSYQLKRTYRKPNGDTYDLYSKILYVNVTCK